MNRLYVKNKDIHSHNTRNNNLLRILKGTANLTNLRARVWNVLTRNLNMYVSYHIFKFKLKLYLMNNSLIHVLLVCIQCIFGYKMYNIPYFYTPLHCT